MVVVVGEVVLTMDFNHGSLLHVTGPVMDLQSKAPAFLVEKLVSSGLSSEATSLNHTLTILRPPSLRSGFACARRAGPSARRAGLRMVRMESHNERSSGACVRPKATMYLPCVYDSTFVFRPEVHLRNGPVIEGLHSSIIRFIASIPGNSFLSAGLLTLIPILTTNPDRREGGRDRRSNLTTSRPHSLLGLGLWPPLGLGSKDP